MDADALSELVGGTDIYLLDQIIKGRITPGMSVLDAGCGAGRNLRYLARAGAEVWGLDQSSEAIGRARRNLGQGANGFPEDRFSCTTIENLDFPERSFDVVICNAVLHFARDGGHFDEMVDAMWKVLNRGGLFFARLASSIGIEDTIEPISPERKGGPGVGRFALPDGSERFLVDETLLLETTTRLGGDLLEPLKTTNVQGLRCMTTWVLRKSEEVNHVRP